MVIADELTINGKKKKGIKFKNSKTTWQSSIKLTNRSIDDEISEMHFWSIELWDISEIVWTRLSFRKLSYLQYVVSMCPQLPD